MAAGLLWTRISSCSSRLLPGAALTFDLLDVSESDDAIAVGRVDEDPNGGERSEVKGIPWEAGENVPVEWVE